jgi:hypothetical protein
MIAPYFCARYCGRNTVCKVTVNGRIRTVSFDLGSLDEALECVLDDLRSTYGTEPVPKDMLFNEMREQYDERTTRDIFDEAIRTLEKEDVIVATNHWIRMITTGKLYLELIFNVLFLFYRYAN